MWSVRKQKIEESTLTMHRGRVCVLNPCTITALRRLTGSMMHLGGEVVMEDSPFELRSHLNFMLRAHGRVLVTGLGLGCVVRGLLASPAVEFVICVEKSRSVLELVEPFMPKDRVEIINADALVWTQQDDRVFDCAWHDIWADRDNGDPHLSRFHVELLANCREKVAFQGAWDLPRWVKKRFAGLRLL